MNEEHGIKDGRKYRGNKHFAERITNVVQGQGDEAKNKILGSLSVRVRRDGPNQEVIQHVCLGSHGASTG